MLLEVNRAHPEPRKIQKAVEILQLLPQIPQEMVEALQGVEGASSLADFIAGMMDVSADEKQALLEIFDLKARLDKLLDLLTHRIEVLNVAGPRASEDENVHDVVQGLITALLRKQRRPGPG